MCVKDIACIWYYTQYQASAWGSRSNTSLTERDAFSATDFPLSTAIIEFHKF